MLRDLRLAVRTLSKQPAFTALAVVTFALGIGADTAIFTVADATLRRSLPFDEPDRLVSLSETQKGEEWMPYSLSYPDLRDWQEQATPFTPLAGATQDRLPLRPRDGAPPPSRRRSSRCSSSRSPRGGPSPPPTRRRAPPTSSSSRTPTGRHSSAATRPSSGASSR